MNILLLYTTNSGSTEMAATEIVNRLSGKHSVTIKKVLEAKADDIKAAEAVILASPSWDFDGKEGQPHEDFFQFKQGIDPTVFENKKMAIMALGDSSYKIFCGAATELEGWVKEWKGIELLPAIRIDKYYFNMAQAQEDIGKWCEELDQKLNA